MKQNHKKLKVALLFGGKSVEYEAALISVRNIAMTIDKSKYDVIYVVINKEGKWVLTDSSLSVKDNSTPISLVPRSGIKTANQGDANSTIVDVVFPVLHGPYGEDGTIQGVLKSACIPFVGCSVLASAVSFDKDFTKRLLRDAGIITAKYLACKITDKISFSKVKKELGLPLFVKPANSGSFVGINKATNEKEFKQAIENAFMYDSKIIIEEYINGGREIECGVLGNENSKASAVGEIVTKESCCSNKEKYIDEHGATLDIPAQLSKTLEKKIKDIAVKTYQVLGCEGLSRIDFLVNKSGQVYVNEVNTMPGFTSISMYPRLWKERGISYTDLIDKLIDLSIERFEKEQKLQESYYKDR
jgi:D-alanine-D-alanine ligase